MLQTVYLIAAKAVMWINKEIAEILMVIYPTYSEDSTASNNLYDIQGFATSDLLFQIDPESPLLGSEQLAEIHSHVAKAQSLVSCQESPSRLLVCNKQQYSLQRENKT